MFSDYSPAEWCDPCKNHGNYPRRPQKSYLHSILSLPFPLQVKNVSHYFPSLIFWSQCLFFFSEDILVTNYFGGDLPSPSKYLSNGLIPRTLNESLRTQKIKFRFLPYVFEKSKVSFLGSRFRPRFSFLKQVIKTGGNESWLHVFDWTGEYIIERP